MTSRRRAAPFWSSGSRVEGYQGNGRTGFREDIRTEYRRLLDAYAHGSFGERLRLVDVTPGHLARSQGA